MKHTYLNHRSHRLRDVLRAWVAATWWMGAAGCNAPQRFESATTDLPAEAEGRESTPAPTAGDAGASTSAGAPVFPVVTGPHHTDDVEASNESRTDAVTDEQTRGLDASSGEPGEVSTSPATSAVTSETNTRSEPTSLAPTSDSQGTPNSMPSPDTTSDEASEPPFDECPEHETQLVAGSCGCGHAPEPKCEELRMALSHRYSFVSHAAHEGYDAATIPDSVGSADGEIHDAEFDWDGSLLLNGQSSYVGLPSGLLSTHQEATLDFWLKWWGGGENQRLLNFGLAPSGPGGTPDNYLSITPSGSTGVITVQYRTNRAPGARLEADDALETSELQHITLVIRERSLSLFVNGVSEATAETPHRLKELDDDSSWLGRALYSDYPLYKGAFFEFRMFSRALTDEEVAKLDEVGLALP